MEQVNSINLSSDFIPLAEWILYSDTICLNLNLIDTSKFNNCSSLFITIYKMILLKNTLLIQRIIINSSLIKVINQIISDINCIKLDVYTLYSEDHTCD